VEKKYGKVHAVKGISMKIENGEFVAFLGPSGCGKSSTMRMIAGLEEITGGDILFDNKSIIQKKPSERNVAMAFENYALYPTLTVYENLAFPLRSAGKKEIEIDQRVREISQIVGLDDLLDKKPMGLSSGRAQAVGVARALIRRPNVLLLDEPISHLDISQRFQMRMYIKRLHIDVGYTTILVTHDQEDAMSMADRIAVMNDGKLNQIATPDDVYNNPADIFVAGFIGNIPMNFLDCNVSRESDKTYIRHGMISLPLPSRFTASSLPEQVVLGVRPHNIHALVNYNVDDSIPCLVKFIETLGDINIVMVTIENTKFQIVTEPSFRVAAGTRIGLRIDFDRICLFEKKSGVNVITI
jgi:ABC-type sugar transport system ATPase subunit